ncbi:MAG: PaaI family thioesterase [Actinomycetota bacterium]
MARVRLHNDDWGYETNCYVCEPTNEHGLRIPFFHDTETDTVVAEIELGFAHSGAPTLVHGGVVLAVLDEAMAWATIAVAHRWALTSDLRCRFRSAVVLDEVHRVEARVVDRDDDRLRCEATVTAPDGTRCTEAEATFVVVGRVHATRLAGTEVGPEHDSFLDEG